MNIQKQTAFAELIRIVFLAGWIGVILIGAGSFAAGKDVERPNVIVILADDQGWGDLSLHGNKNLQTPSLDSLAKQGAQFERFFVCPVCSPTRAEFLTGRYHQRLGVYGTSRGGERMNLNETTIAQLFQKAGYRTNAIGKWHNGMQHPYHPCGRGFDHFYGFCSGHWGNYYSPMLERDGKIVRGKGYVTDDFTDEAINTIKQKHDHPFFIYLTYNTPHSPMQVPDKWWKKFADRKLESKHREPDREKLNHTRAALAMVENIDWNVGRIMQALEETGKSENTIVVYFSDNGPNGFRYNGGMKGRKGSTEEGGVRSPLFIRWPTKIKPGTKIGQVCGAINLLPTLCELCDIKINTENKIDGVSFEPLLMKPELSDWPEQLLLSHWGGRYSIRSQTHRLSHDGKFYDLINDPGQNNPIKKDSMLRVRMSGKRSFWKAAMEKEQWLAKAKARPMAIADSSFSYTQLPARDANFTGKIRRSNRHPNCTFLTQWKNLSDQIEWDVEVSEGGEFDVEIYYTCPADDVGSTLQLKFGDQRLTSKITVANDPPLVGEKRDRSKRIESYTKEFRPLKMGSIKLTKGKDKLILKATDIPGSQVGDFRLLMLTRKK